MKIVNGLISSLIIVLIICWFFFSIQSSKFPMYTTIGTNFNTSNLSTTTSICVSNTFVILGNILGNVVGLDPAGVEATTNIGGTIGARRFSKDFELEADALGARIAEAAGYDALRGVLYFERAPDPGDRFLGTHPPNPDRIRIVRQTVGG